MGYDIPGKDAPVKRTFIERVSEEIMREFQTERNQDMDRRRKQIMETKLFPALNEATQQFHNRESSV